MGVLSFDGKWETNCINYPIAFASLCSIYSSHPSHIVLRPKLNSRGSLNPFRFGSKVAHGLLTDLPLCLQVAKLEQIWQISMLAAMNEWKTIPSKNCCCCGGETLSCRRRDTFCGRVLLHKLIKVFFMQYYCWLSRKSVIFRRRALTAESLRPVVAADQIDHILLIRLLGYLFIPRNNKWW